MPFKWRNRFQYYSVKQQKPCCLFIVNKQHPFLAIAIDIIHHKFAIGWMETYANFHLFSHCGRRHKDMEIYERRGQATCILDVPSVSESCLFQFKFFYLRLKQRNIDILFSRECLLVDKFVSAESNAVPENEMDTFCVPVPVILSVAQAEYLFSILIRFVGKFIKLLGKDSPRWNVGKFQRNFNLEIN